MLTARYCVQNCANLFMRWCRNSNLKTTRPNWLDNFGEGLAISNDSAKRHISLHCSSESSLGLLSEVVKLMDDDHLECLLLLLVELLAARNLLNEFLNDHFIVVLSLTWGDFNVIVRRKHNALHGGATRCASFEFLQLRFDLMHGRGRVEFLQQTLDERTLATSRGSIEKDMGEVVTLGKTGEHLNLIGVHGDGILKIHGPVLFDPEALFTAHCWLN